MQDFLVIGLHAIDHLPHERTNHAHDQRHAFYPQGGHTRVLLEVAHIFMQESSDVIADRWLECLAALKDHIQHIEHEQRLTRVNEGIIKVKHFFEGERERLRLRQLRHQEWNQIYLRAKRRCFNLQREIRRADSGLDELNATIALQIHQRIETALCAVGGFMEQVQIVLGLGLDFGGILWEVVVVSSLRPSQDLL